MVRGFESLERHGMLWKLRVRGAAHSPLVVNKDSKGKGEGEMASGRRMEGKGKVEKGVFFFIPP